MSKLSISLNSLHQYIPQTLQRSLLVALLMSSGFSQAATIYTDGDKSFNFGMGLSTSISNGTGQKMGLDDMRVYTGGKISKAVGFTFNMVGAGAAGTMTVMDAIGQIEITPEVNLWMGQLLPAFDRQGLNGPYYSSASNKVYAAAGLAANYPAKFYGRDTGLELWGDIANFKYQLGVFNGAPYKAVGGGYPNTNPDQLYSMRLSYALLDAEPGYYTSGTNYGSKNIATIGAYWQSQKNGYGTEASPSNYTGMGMDFLLEKKLDGGAAASLEGGYSKFDLGNNLVAPTTYGALYYNVPFQGVSWFIQPAYYSGVKIGPGSVQPYVKYTKSTPDTGFGAESDQSDVGVGYIIKGFDTRVFLNYSKPSTATGVTSLSMQMQF